MKQRRIVITGGAGFIGSQLGFELVKLGWDVVLLDNMWAGHLDNLIIDGKTFGTFLAKDIRDPNLPRFLDGAEVVLHLAAVAHIPVCQVDPQFAFDVNTSGTAHVLEAARQVGVRRVVFSSTSAVYERSEGARHREDDTVAPDLVYAVSKLAAEKLCEGFAAIYGMDIIQTRFFNVYGPHQDFRRSSPPLISYVARELHAGRTPVLYNQSDSRRDYIHSADAIRLLVRMIEAENRYEADVFNVGSGEGYSVPELYQRMSRIAGRTIEPEFRDPITFWDAHPSLHSGGFAMSQERIRKEVYKTAIADTAKVEKEFSWRAEIGLDEGLASVYEYAATH